MTARKFFQIVLFLLCWSVLIIAVIDDLLGHAAQRNLSPIDTLLVIVFHIMLSLFGMFVLWGMGRGFLLSRWATSTQKAKEQPREFLNSAPQDVNARYILGDDGELIELDTDEKRKHDDPTN